MKVRKTACGGRDGAVLVVAMAMLSMLALVATSIIGINLAEFRSGGYVLNLERAFYNASGGMNYVINSINRDLVAGRFSLVNETSTVIYVNYAPPSTHYSFEPVRRLERVNEFLWVFTVTGNYATSKSVIEVCVRRDRLGSGDIGVFGGDSMDFKPMAEVYSYRSEDLLEPTPADSTGEGNIGSNGSVTIGNHSVIDGIIKMGTDALGFHHAFPAGYNCEAVPWINPDPLGATNGPLADAFAQYRLTNDNAAAGIAGTVLSCGPHSTVTLNSGVYYLTELSLGSHSTLNVVATRESPVVIFLQGKMNVQPFSEMNVSSKLPTAFYIFSDYSGTHTIKPGGDFFGFIYSPYAELFFLPMADLYGAFWGREIQMQPHGDVYIDQSISDMFLSSTVSVAQWRRL